MTARVYNPSVSLFDRRRDRRGKPVKCAMLCRSGKPGTVRYGEHLVCADCDALVKLIEAQAHGPSRKALAHIGRPCANPDCTRGVIRRGAAYCSLKCRVGMKAFAKRAKRSEALSRPVRHLKRKGAA